MHPNPPAVQEHRKDVRSDPRAIGRVVTLPAQQARHPGRMPGSAHPHSGPGSGDLSEPVGQGRPDCRCQVVAAVIAIGLDADLDGCVCEEGLDPVGCGGREDRVVVAVQDEDRAAHLVGDVGDRDDALDGLDGLVGDLVVAGDVR